MDPTAVIGAGTVIWSHAVVGARAVVGRDCKVGHAAYIDRDVCLGDRVWVHNKASVYRPVRVGNDVFIVEGLDLTKAAPGDYLFVVLPLKLKGGDGTPARAVLLS